jgi:ssDNA-binding Zn-finger/Zn-ribbon topoisomerase 1
MSDYVYIADGCLDARDIEFKGVPPGVMICPICRGNGKYVQNYFEGRLIGPCAGYGCCDVTGFVYTNTGRAVPISVTNQIAVASGLAAVLISTA